MSVLGQQIRKARENMNLSRVEFGSMIDVSESTIRNWETGITIPNRKTKNKIFQVTGQSAEWFDSDLEFQQPKVVRERIVEYNPFAVDKSDPETQEELFGAYSAVKDGRVRISQILAYLRDLDNSMLALENRLGATIGSDE